MGNGIFRILLHTCFIYIILYNIIVFLAPFGTIYEYSGIPQALIDQGGQNGRMSEKAAWVGGKRCQNVPTNRVQPWCSNLIWERSVQNWSNLMTSHDQQEVLLLHRLWCHKSDCWLRCSAYGSSSNYGNKHQLPMNFKEKKHLKTCFTLFDSSELWIISRRFPSGNQTWLARWFSPKQTTTPPYIT
jgi:hypothetical protein